LALLSGDNDADRVKLSNLFPSTKSLFFRQKPLDKLKFVEMLQVSGEKVMMLGDGLNDAGALQKSDVGIAVTERPHQFTPASDGILHASAITRLFDFIRLAKWSRVIIVASFGLSFLYNIVGLSFAVSGNLTPLTAAILMPLSSISVVLFATATVNLVSMRLKLL
jgi:Cu+-exporting ATPase